MFKRLCIFILFLFYFFPKISYATGENWLTGWNYRKQITIDADQVSDVGSSDYTDFPVLISLSGLSNIKEDGVDIRFTSSIGVTELAREIESYSSDTGTLTAWVKIPVLDYNDDTVIYMYYGNADASEPAADSDYGSQNVWTNNYAGVWHLNETGTNPTVYDSSSNANNSINQTWTPTTGKFSGGGSFNGSSNSINISSTNSLNPASITMSGWVNADVNNKWQYLASKNGQWNFGRDNSGKYYLAAWNSTTNVTDAHASTTATTGQWQYIVFTYDGSRAKYYVDSSLVIDDEVTGNLNSTDNILTIGSQGGDGNFWDGLIDDVKVTATSRSAGWIATEYNNQNSPSTFTLAENQESENITYVLTYTANANGSINGVTPQTVGNGSSGSAVTAVPDAHYHFVDWSDGLLTAIRSDTNVSQNIGVTANFAIDTYTVNFSAGSNGSISGTSSQIIDYGSDSSSVTAVADSGYHFTNWSDGNTQNPRQILMVTANKSVTANFAADDVNAPVISSITASPNSNSASITWVTNENSSSLVQYGLNPSYGFNTTEADTSPGVTSHTVSLSNLKACARYYYRVISSDTTSNQSASPQKTFNTSGCATSNISGGTDTVVAVTGGSVQLINSLSVASLNIPDNFASEPATFQINKLNTDNAPSAPDGKAIASNNFYNLVAVTETDHQLEEFDEDITFTVTYGSDTESSYDESTLDIYKYDGSSWIKKNCVLDTVANTLTCSLTNFSVYAVLGQPINNSSSSSVSPSNSSSSTNSSSVCSGSKPLFVSDLFEVRTTPTTAKLFFTPQADTSEFYISFSEKPQAEEHGERVNLIREGVQSHTVYLLKPNTTYYVKVRGHHGCMPGKWSNIMKFTTNNSIYYEYGPTRKSSVSPPINISVKPQISAPSVAPSPVQAPTIPQKSNHQPEPKHCFLWWCW